jgi:DNA-binding NarL/FixJ family response regulator
VSLVRVLVVDDFEPFRRLIFSILQNLPELQIIGEVSDGAEAVQKAQELQPDLIMLDIALPNLNGIEAARRIRKLAPRSRIIFLSQESSADVVQEALASGGVGYVVKAHAGSELVAAVRAVLQGKQFVGSGSSGHPLIDLDSKAPDCPCQEEDFPSPTEGKGNPTRGHEVHFYRDDASFLLGFTCFIESGLKAGKTVIVLSTEPHRKSLLQELRVLDVDTNAAIEQGQLILLDVAETLAKFMANDLPDLGRFSRFASDLLAIAAKGTKKPQGGIAACGEGAPILWAQGKPDAAIQVEHLWDEIAKTCNVDILCGYVLTSFQRERESHVYDSICAEHSAVYSH